MVGMWEYIETKYLAAPLRDKGLLNHSEFLTLMNDCVPLLDRRNNLLYMILPSKGDQRKILAKFYYCMLHSQIPQEIPQKLRTYGMHYNSNYMTSSNIKLNTLVAFKGKLPMQL